MKGKSLICSMIERRSDEKANGEPEARVAEIVTKSFEKRPTFQDGPLISIANMMNNSVFVGNKPGSVYNCDAAFLFLVKNSYRWMISGTSRVLYFVDRKLVNQSEKKEFPRIGLQPSFTPELGPINRIIKGQNAFFLCSKALTDKIGEEGIEKALADSQTQDEWMRKVEEMAGDTDFAAQALILPEQRKAPILSFVIFGIMAAIIAYLLLFR